MNAREFTDAHEEALIHSAWHAVSDQATSTPYLFKFAYDEDDVSCCLLITDTKDVWVEVMATRHMLWRARRTEHMEEDATVDQVITMFPILAKLHSFAVADTLNTEFVATANADLQLNLRHENIVWQWELQLLPRVRAAVILSKQLVLPMLNWSGYVMDSYMQGVSTDHELRRLERALDASGRTAKRHPDKMVESVIRQPLFATSLRRLTESGLASGSKSAVICDADDEHLPPAARGPPAASPPPPPRARERQAPVKAESPRPKAEPSMSPGPSQPISNAGTRVKAEVEEEDGQGLDDSETETEPEEDQDEPVRKKEEEEEEEEEKKVVPDDEEDEEEEEYHPKREARLKEEEDADEDDGEDSYKPPPSKSTRGSARRKPTKPEPASSPEPPPASRTRKRRRQAAAEEDEDVDMDAPKMKKEEEEEEKPEVKPIFVPKARVHVKRSKY